MILIKILSFYSLAWSLFCEIGHLFWWNF